MSGCTPTGRVFGLYREAETRFGTFLLGKQAAARRDAHRGAWRRDDAGGLNIFNATLTDGLVGVFKPPGGSGRRRLRPARQGRRKDLRFRRREKLKIFPEYSGDTSRPREYVL